MQGVLRDEGADTRALLQPGPGREAEMVADIDARCGVLQRGRIDITEGTSHARQ